eukprot:723067-Hanusia_phi.AAC.1
MTPPHPARYCDNQGYRCRDDLFYICAVVYFLAAATCTPLARVRGGRGGASSWRETGAAVLGGVSRSSSKFKIAGLPTRKEEIWRTGEVDKCCPSGHLVGKEVGYSRCLILRGLLDYSNIPRSSPHLTRYHSLTPPPSSDCWSAPRWSNDLLLSSLPGSCSLLLLHPLTDWRGCQAVL